MPRIRTIKPEFYRHHDLFLAERKSGFPIRVAFSGLWCCADVEGRFKWRPTELKLDILPYDEVDFEDVLQCLIDTKFIIKYSVEGKEYGVIPTFKDHQRITGTESKYPSKLPEYKETQWKHNGNTMEIHNDSINSDEKSQPPDNHNGNILEIHDDYMETFRQVGKDGRNGIKEKERSIGSVPENFLLFEIYNKPFDEVKKIFKNISEKGFLRWRKFIDFVYENSLSEIFRYKCINPHDFEKLDFPENRWDETIRSILSTGIEEKHNLFFRIPQFLKYLDKNKLNGHNKKSFSKNVSADYND